jgi:medium-chain acyl-[acyl-carrier-protein] hydrolase
MPTTAIEASPWFVCPKPNPRAGLRLFCFPYAGGGTLIYRAWPAALERVAELHIVQLPGRERRLAESPYTSVGALVSELSEAIAGHLDLPFAFFGHSMGAVLSFELARRLRRERGVEPRHLFVSGRSAPQLPRREPCTFDLPEPEFVQELINLNGTPREVLENPELRQLLLPLLRADFAVCQTYEYDPGRPLACPITALGGIGDRVSREDLEGWREQTVSRFMLRMFPGDHFFLNSAQATLLEVIARDLQRHAGASL